jgi:hypothetical protein
LIFLDVFQNSGAVHGSQLGHENKFKLALAGNGFFWTLLFVGEVIPGTSLNSIAAIVGMIRVASCW